MSKSDRTKDSGFLSTLESIREARNGELPVLRWVVLSNFTQDQLRPFVKQASEDIGHDAELWIGGFDTALQDANGAECGNADVVVVALRLQGVSPALVDRFVTLTAAGVQAEAVRVLDYVTAVVSAVRQRSRALILVHAFETPVHPELGTIDYRSPVGQVNTVRRLNLDLAERLSREDGVFVIDLDGIRARLAGDRFVDPRTWHLGRVPYTRRAMRAIAGEYLNIVRAAKGFNKKCLVVDADGTLWGGIVGEDGIDGVRIGPTYPGSPFHDFQRTLLAMRARGILLALCSKNDESLVTELFTARAADMPLRLEDFAAIRVNWTDKAQNIADIAAELSLGLDSLVFVDDNPFETELVQQLLPNVRTIQLPSDPVEYRDALLAHVHLFDTLTFSDEDRRRSDMYAEERRRRAERTSSMSVVDYLRGLDMEATIDRVDEASVARVAQLTQKTNQFNLTTRRHTEHDVRECASSNAHDVYAVRLRDRLGDSGIVGVGIVHHEAERSMIETFLLSCRVLGRGLEDVLLSTCIRRAHQRGSERVVGLFAATSKNSRVADFYPTHGFTADGAGRFERTCDALPAFPTHFKSIVIDGERVI